MSDWHLNAAELDRDITRGDDDLVYLERPWIDEIDPATGNDGQLTTGNSPAPVASIDAMIDEYTEARTAYDLAMADMERERAAILATVQAQLDDVTAEFGPLLATADDKIKALDATIKAAVLKDGKTHKGRRWEYRFTAGKRGVKVDAVVKLAKRQADPVLRALIENLIDQGTPGVSVYQVVR